MKIKKDYRLIAVCVNNEEEYYQIQYKYKILWLFPVWRYLKKRVSNSRSFAPVTALTLNVAKDYVKDDIKIKNTVFTKKVIYL